MKFGAWGVKDMLVSSTIELTEKATYGLPDGGSAEVS